MATHTEKVNVNTHKDFFESIDWELLRERKSALLKIVDDHPALEGLLTLVDSVQDYAVDELGMPETVVFQFEESS